MMERCLRLAAVALLAACFITAAYRAVTLSLRDAGLTGEIIIRIGHYQLEPGLQKAIDAIARLYEEENPGVQVVQMAIPENIYSSWLTTQLVGQTAPDILELDTARINAEKMARYFSPISLETEVPNPYNHGTLLENTPWRNTFVDGLTSTPAFNPALAEVFGVNLTMQSVRLFVNLDLLESLTGQRSLPRNFDDFLALCDSISQASAPDGRAIVPIAGSRYNGPLLIDRLFASQTQQLMVDMDQLRTLGGVPGQDMAIALLQDRFSLRSEEIQAGLELVRTMAAHMQPGFSQLRREDAMFYFLQGRAVMIAATSSDAPTLRGEIPFEVSVEDIPLPESGHPRFGTGILGRPSDAQSTLVTFGLVNFSKNQAQALDFLQFLTSKRINQKFAEISHWLPSIAGVAPALEMEAFYPELGTSPTAGFNLRFGGNMPDANRVYQTGLFHLVNQAGSVEDFTRFLERELPNALRSDLRRSVNYIRQNDLRQDTLMAAYWWLSQDRAQSVEARKLSNIVDSQLRIEELGAWQDYMLRQLQPQ